MQSRQSFIYLLSGKSLSNFSSILFQVAMVASIYNATESATSTAMIPLSASIAKLVSGLIAPTIMDKLSLKKILLIFQLFKCIAIVSFLLLVNTAIGNIQIVLLTVVLISLMDGWINPAQRALVPILIEKSKDLHQNLKYQLE